MRKHWSAKLTVCAVVAAAAMWVSLAAAGGGGGLAISWFTIDGGGGESTGGGLKISGTIGQPDAGRMTGDNYVIDGGFWSGVGATGGENAVRSWTGY